MPIVPRKTPTPESIPQQLVFAAAPRTYLNGRKRVHLISIEKALEFAQMTPGFRIKEIMFHDGSSLRTWDWSDRKQYAWLCEHSRPQPIPK